MTCSVALCADAESLQRPELIGLAGEDLQGQRWLASFSSGAAARRFLRENQEVREVWVASSDDVDAVNLAAALKRDAPSRCVCLLAFQGSGSLFSRVRTAGIDAVLSHQAFAERYAEAKRCAREVRTASPLAGPVPASPSRAAFLLPVVSGSGGAGKSTVAALAAMLACRRGHRTLLLDLDLRFGDEQAMLGRSDAVAVDELLADAGRLTAVGAGEGVPALVAAPQRLERAELVEPEIPRLLATALPRFDVVVANTGSCWGELHAALLERCSQALFLIDQRVSSLRACQHALELCARCGIAVGPFLFAVNRCSKRAPFTSLDVSCALQGAHAVELRDGGQEVEELLSAGLPEELASSRNELCLSIDELLNAVLSKAPRSAEPAAAAPSRPRGIFGRRRTRQGEVGGHDAA